MGNSEVLETRDERDWTSRCFIVATGNPSLLFPPLRDASLGPGSLVRLASLADFFSPYSPLRSLIPGYRDACGGRCSYRIWARKQPFTKTGHATNTTWRGGYSVYIISIRFSELKSVHTDSTILCFGTFLYFNCYFRLRNIFPDILPSIVPNVLVTCNFGRAWA